MSYHADKTAQVTSERPCWWVVMEGAEGWCPPPDGSDLPDGSKPFGDGIATRSPFNGNSLTMSFPKGVGQGALH